MSDRKRHILEAAERIGFFGEANPQLATELPSTVEDFAANQTNIERLHAAGITSASSGSARTSETRSKVARVKEITDDLRRVAKAARRIEKKIKDFRNTFMLPRGNLTYQEVIERADSFIADAPANQTYFNKYALTTEFFTELAEDVEQFREAAHGQADAHRTGVGAHADTEAILEDTLDTREELKTAIEIHYRDNPAKLAEWLTASHIERKKKKTGTPPEEPETPEE